MNAELDKVTFNLTDNEKLAEYIARKDPGQQCKFVITASLDEADGKAAIFSIDEVRIQPHAGDKAEETAAEPDADDDADEGIIAWAKEKATPAAASTSAY